MVVATFGSSAGQPAPSCQGAIVAGHSGDDCWPGPDEKGVTEVAAVNTLTAVQLDALAQERVAREPNAPEPSKRPRCQLRPPSVLTIAKSKGTEEEDFS